jgi:mono/diheme cytochrome c family protein
VKAFAFPALALALFATSAAADPVFSRGRGFDEQGGAALYDNVCAACHQPDANGANGAASYPALASNDRLGSSGYVVSAVLDGLNAMPPFGDMMSDAQIADVTNYVRTHFGNSYTDAVSEADVAAARRRDGTSKPR